MKHFLFSSFLSLSLAFCSVAQPLKAYLTYSRFLSPESGPYIETYITVVGNSVVYTKNESGKFQGIIEVAVEFMKEDSIIYFDQINHCVNTEEISADLNSRRLFTLSQYGHYLFLLKLSIHFTRLTESIARSSP